jgi:hypothetical protein
MISLCLLLAAAACHHASPPGADASAIAADATASEWIPLVTRSWSLAANDQRYQCRRIQVAQDMWIGGFRALAPAGTHHAVVSLSKATTPLGDYDCDPGALASEMQLLYGSGVNTDDLAFPDGIAVHLHAGDYVNLQLHLFDASDQPLAGESGVLVKLVAPATVVHEAEMTFAGTITISIPPDSQPHTASGACTMNRDMHFVALFPHMHRLGVHQSLVATHAGVAATLLDVPFVFGEQREYPIADTSVQQGDRIDVTCTYVNTTGAPVAFGNSSTDEMCFTGIYAYPATGELFSCVN